MMSCSSMTFARAGGVLGRSRQRARTHPSVIMPRMALMDSMK